MCFGRPHSRDPILCWISLSLCIGMRLFYFKLGSLLADGEAYRSLWESKGAAGNAPCLLCKNVVSFDCTGSPYLVHLSCHDSRRFDPSANADIWSTADKLEAVKHDGTPKGGFRPYADALRLDLLTLQLVVGRRTATSRQANSGYHVRCHALHGGQRHRSK